MSPPSSPPVVKSSSGPRSSKKPISAFVLVTFVVVSFNSLLVHFRKVVGGLVHRLVSRLSSRLCFSNVYKKAESLTAWVLSHVVINVARFWLDFIFFHSAILYNFLARTSKGCTVVERQYGPHKHEKMDVVTPDNPEHSLPAILYVHGGGWVCCNKRLLLQMVTPFARDDGFHAYSIDYPYAPEQRFPTQVISVLRALKMMKNDGHDRVHIMGDSAGANLVCLATAVLENPKLFRNLEAIVDEPIGEWAFPKILKVASLFGVLDRDSYRHRWGAWFVNNVLINNFQCPKGSFDNKILFTDNEHHIESYPETFFVCGDADLLIHSSERAHNTLQERGLKSRMSVYPGNHGFVGMPWAPGRAPAMKDLKAFFKAPVATVDEPLSAIAE